MRVQSMSVIVAGSMMILVRPIAAEVAPEYRRYDSDVELRWFSTEPKTVQIRFPQMGTIEFSLRRPGEDTADLVEQVEFRFPSDGGDEWTATTSRGLTIHFHFGTNGWCGRANGESALFIRSNPSGEGGEGILTALLPPAAPAAPAESTGIADGFIIAATVLSAVGFLILIVRTWK